MATNTDVCYYGRHIGCLNADDPECRGCAERLTKAVQRELHLASSAAGEDRSEHRLWFDEGVEVHERTGALASVKHACAKICLLLLIWR